MLPITSSLRNRSAPITGSDALNGVVCRQRSPFDVNVRGALLYRCDIYMSKMSARRAFSLVKDTCVKWSDHQAPRLGASVAFYSILSFAPLLVLVTALIALVFGHESAQNALVNEAKS